MEIVNMGYTNYWHQKRNFNDAEWKQLTEEYDYLKDCGRIEPYDKNPDQIAFNAKGNGCETFVLNKNLDEYFKSEHMGSYYKEKYEKDGNHFDFCKTRMFPYDIDVWHMLKVARIVSPDNITEISRDR